MQTAASFNIKHAQKNYKKMMSYAYTKLIKLFLQDFAFAFSAEPVLGQCKPCFCT